MAERVTEQLNALRSVARLLEHAGIEFWMFGGWAVDFLRRVRDACAW